MHAMKLMQCLHDIFCKLPLALNVDYWRQHNDDLVLETHCKALALPSHAGSPMLFPHLDESYLIGGSNVVGDCARKLINLNFIKDARGSHFAISFIFLLEK